MGCSGSKADKDEALRLCKERRRFIKQAIDSRYAMAASHLSYVQSLRNIGVALRRFAESEALIESSLSTSATEIDKTPSHSSYLSPSPSNNAENVESPLHNESPLSPPMSTLSYMRLGGSAATTVRINPPTNSFMDDDSLTFPLPPPPPPHFEAGSSWDFFDKTESFRFTAQSGLDFCDNASALRHFREELVPFLEEERESEKGGLEGNSDALLGAVRPESRERASEISNDVEFPNKIGGGAGMNTAHSVDGAALEKSNSERGKTLPEKDLCAEREDPSEFITHRAKDFLSSIKDIENRFTRASESGKEVSRMLESNKIQLSCSESKGHSPASAFLAVFHLVCCQGENVLVSQDPLLVTKVITWNRSTSSCSSSSKNPLATQSKDDIDDNGSDFVEEFCMISGSHSSTLDRLYAWERKLYDEVKASESIRKEYDQKCDQLRNQFAKDMKPQVIDKTRAVVKDLHSQIRVAIHAVDSISKRIEKLRDEELLPQLLELTQGLIRMWKAMLECHHAQYITIQLAYHAKSSAGTPQGDSHMQVLAHLQHEIECFGIRFAGWVNTQKSYVEALNGWLQNCIIQPQERSKVRRAFSPRRALAPPIFVLFRDWSAGIKALPSGEVADAINHFLSDVHGLMGEVKEQQKKQGPSDSDQNGESESKEDEKFNKSSNLSCIHTSLTTALELLTKFSEASLKMFEAIRQESVAAHAAYANCRIARF